MAKGSEESSAPSTSGADSVAPDPGSQGAGAVGAKSAAGSTAAGLVGDAAKAKLSGASTGEAVSGAAKQGAQKVAEAGIKKATGTEIAGDALRSAQKAKSGDYIGGAQDLAASGANAAVTGAVGATGIGAPVATLAGSAAGSLVRSKLGRVLVSAILVFGLLISVGQAAIVGIATMGAVSAITAIMADQDDDSDACTDGTSVLTGDQVMSGSSIEQKVWNYLTGSAGFTKEQAAGIMGNIKRESQFNPFLAEGVKSKPNVSRGWGLVQWTGSRHAAIRDKVVAEPTLGQGMYLAAPSYTAMPKGLTQDKIDAMTMFQLQYIIGELNGPEAGAGKAIRSATTVDQATRVFEDKYERAGVVAIDERLQWAQKYFDQFSKAPAAPAPGAAATTPPATGATAAPAAPGAPAAAGTYPSVAGYAPEYVGIAAKITATMKAMGANDKAIIMAITTAIQESDLGRNKKDMTTMDSNNDQGLYQMRVVERDGAYYGTPAQVQDPVWATQAWYKGVNTKAGHMTGLLDIKGWEGMGYGQAIHKVQGNADSNTHYYDEKAPIAKQIYAVVSGVSPGSLDDGTVGGPCGGDTPQLTGDLTGPVGAANSLAGKFPYVFGGGNGDGPSTSHMRGEDAGEVGFDCSGVTSYAYKKGAGITLPRMASSQWAAFRGHSVTASQIQPGDLIFYAYGRKGATVSHVAIYVGQGQMVEASHSANRVRLTPARVGGSGFVGIARIITSGPAPSAPEKATATSAA